jgi:MFS family permease
MPSAVGIVAEQFPQSRQKAIGLFSSVFPIGLIIGPNLGGWLVSSFGWRSIFWINVPVGLMALIASALLLHPSKRVEEKIDLIGAGLVGGSISSFMLGLSLLGYENMRLMALVPCLVAFILIFLLIRHEKRTEDPILDFEVLGTKPFMAANTYNFVYGCAVIGVMSLVPVFAVSVYGMNALECGLLLTPRSVGMIVASTVTSLFIERFGYRRPMIAGTTLTVAGLLFLSYEPGSITALYVIMGLLGLAVGAISPAANNACIELMPERAATITGVRGMFRQIGGALSITVATLLLHTVGDMALGFRIIFIGIAVAFIAAIPLIFLMPSSPGHK